MVPLTRLAGTTCDNRQPNEWISGAWYNPDANGEGFVVEVIEDGRGVVYWFTHQPDDSGRQAWMTGDGHFDGQTLIIDNLLQPVGTRFRRGFRYRGNRFCPLGSLGDRIRRRPERPRVVPQCGTRTTDRATTRSNVGTTDAG